MIRRADWYSRLSRTVCESRRERFSWGKFDCCSFVARCLDAMTGGDYAARLSRCYRDQQTARAFIEAYGGIAAAVSTFLGEAARLEPLLAGDVCLVPTIHGEGVGISLGASIAVAGDGVVLYPAGVASKMLWRVGVNQ